MKTACVWAAAAAMGLLGGGSAWAVEACTADAKADVDLQVQCANEAARDAKWLADQFDARLQRLGMVSIDDTQAKRKRMARAFATVSGRSEAVGEAVKAADKAAKAAVAARAQLYAAQGTAVSTADIMAEAAKQAAADKKADDALAAAKLKFTKARDAFDAARDTATYALYVEARDALKDQLKATDKQRAETLAGPELAKAADKTLAQAARDEVHAQVTKAVAARDDAWKAGNRALALADLALKSDDAVLGYDDKPDSPWPGLHQATQFIKALEHHPDVAAYVGGSGMTLTSTAGGGNVSLKKTFESWSGRDTQLAMTLNAPFDAGTKGVSPLLANNARLNELAGAASVTLSGSMLVPRSLETPQRTGFWLGGWEATLGYRRLEYYDTAFDPASVAAAKKVPEPMSVADRQLSVALLGGYIPDDTSYAFLARWSYSGAKKSQEEKSFCAPSATPPYTDCVSGPVGAPVDRKTQVITFEFRKALGKVAIAPALSYNNKGVKAVELPIYLGVFSSAADVSAATPTGFNGGVSLGWRSDTKGSISVFAGVPFSLFGGGP